MADELDTHEKRHGILGSKEWPCPVCVTDMGNVQARLTFTDVKAHEYLDTEEVLHEKITLLAAMIRDSNEMITYTGAGISVAAGIDDYATKVKDVSITAAEMPRVKDWKDARPTLTHRVLTGMYEAGYLKHWIQQNHDSLPQKAGYPQSCLNEIHGSLHDPGNPVVPYEGSLRDDLYAWLHHWQERNDLCLALGTSMSGFNCDSVPEAAAQKFLQQPDAVNGMHKGLVIVNLQRTPYDEVSSLRIYAKVDTVMPLLAEALGIADTVRPMDHAHVFSPAEGSVVEAGSDMFIVPFSSEAGEHQGSSASGGKADTAQTPNTVWDLRPGSWVKLTGGPYEGEFGQVVGKNAAGHWRLRFSNCEHPSFPGARMKPFSLWLGNWWVEEATRGKGICPGGKIPFVAATPAEAEAAAAAAGGGQPGSGKRGGAEEDPGRANCTGSSAAEEPAGAARPVNDLAKYEKMMKMGMPMGAIEQRMVKDGVAGGEIAAFSKSVSASAA
eukprot:CAMPEP_0119478302 /NCGR_PEP_ID=MMETSP1344-20130328/8102_1 /TAXON_ID=236787 /ORGANISM="Florenciella parvula, Strain CCMP2471" /LENGTH=495 /DNA_ID=CAMNT_0007512465 /DNA_START=93 /DNA_END=1580 /DNA_ORIENTATION=+